MSLSNDHYYGHVNRFLVENAVTWLECAAASVCWGTMLVYYLEDPYGHLMDEVMGQAQGRTKVRGNLFSFTTPWEDIERCCRRACQEAPEPARSQLRTCQEELGLPHSEEVLQLLVYVHIRGWKQRFGTTFEWIDDACGCGAGVNHNNAAQWLSWV